MKLRFSRAMVWGLLSAMLPLLAEGPLAAQTPDKSGDEERGYTFYEQFEGSSNTLGQIMKFDTSVGYNFNRFFGVDAGIPVYVVRGSSTTSSTTPTNFTSFNGAGNAYTELKLTVDNPLLDFASTLTGTAPTANTKHGLSTGRATFDWTNHFDRSFLGFQPFANVGVANSISDTHFFSRPFTSLGKVAELEGGANYSVLRVTSIGASLYADEPWGQQKIFSRLIKRQTSGGPSSRKGHGAFENSAETVGSASLDRDNGFSAWVNASPIRSVDFEVGFSRSVHYKLNTVSFGIGLNVASLVKKATHF